MYMHQSYMCIILIAKLYFSILNYTYRDAMVTDWYYLTKCDSWRGQ